MDQAEFVARIREHYPEGLTGVFAVGGTRTAYLLDSRANPSDLGKISDFNAYLEYGEIATIRLMETFFDLGGQNMVLALFSFQGFYERGPEYGEQAANLCLRVINDEFVAFYHKYNVDPYFAGIDTLLHMPEDTVEHRIAQSILTFQANWAYQPDRRKVVWEVAPIPLFSFWQADKVMGAEARAALDAEIAQTTDMSKLNDILYRYYARAAYGTDIPMPHFYLGTNRNGDLKLRAVLPISMLVGGPFRLYYTPYPSLYTTPETMRAVLEDLAFGKAFRSFKTDYSGQYTTTLIEAEHDRVLNLRQNPTTTVGLTRQVGSASD